MAVASKKVIDGKDLIMLLDGVPIAHATSHSMDISRADRSFVSKDTGDFESGEAGRGSGTFSINALTFYDTGVGATIPEMVDRKNVFDVYDLLKAGTIVTILFTTEETGDQQFTAKGYLNKLTLNSPNAGENSDYSAGGKLTEWPTHAAIV